MSYCVCRSITIVGEAVSQSKLFKRSFCDPGVVAVWYIESITVSYGSNGVFTVPSLRFGQFERRRFDYMTVGLRNTETGRLWEMTGSVVYANRLVVKGSLYYKNLINTLDSNKVYGFFGGGIAQDGCKDCTLVAVDSLSYQFLGHVNAVRHTHVGTAFFTENRPHFEFKLMDRDGTFVQVNPFNTPVAVFPLLQVIVSYPGGWREADGKYYLWKTSDRQSRLNMAGEFAYCVDFVDVEKARAFIAKAAVSYGGHPVSAGIDLLSSIRGL